MKKSYKGLWLWLVVYCIGFLPIIFARTDGRTATRLTLLYTAIMMNILMLIIEKTDSVYWINGVTFEVAEKAGYEKRMEFANAHLKTFTRFTVFYLVFTLICHLLKLSIEKATNFSLFNLLDLVNNTLIRCHQILSHKFF